jgi:endonuclease/exonuclease/phosphatase family metal-dependent hydrolase
MSEFSLLSLNTFGVPFYLGYRRLERIAAEVTTLAPSVLCLQEIQQNAYLALLQRELPGYAYLAYFRNRFAPQGGLFTASLSSCPITSSEFYPFPNRGAWFSLGFADRALHKGVLGVNLAIQGQPVIVLNTHLQANYAGDWRPTNRQASIQLEQAQTLAELARGQPADAWVFLCGDFNFPRQSLAYQQLLAQSGLTDPLAGDPRPTYQPLPLVPAKWSLALDYALYRAPGGEGGGAEVRADILPIVNTKARRPAQRFLTDHHALRLSIR